MAAGKWKLYDSFKLKLGQGLILLNSHTFKVALFSSSSNANDLTHDELADLTNQVANGNGYTTGGATLGTVTWTQSTSLSTFDSADISWIGSGAGFTCRYAVIYDDTVAGDPLVAICVMDSSDVVVAASKELLITIDASGIFGLSGATSD